MAFLLAYAQTKCLQLGVSETSYKAHLPQFKKLLRISLNKRIVSFNVNSKKGSLDVVSSNGLHFVLHRFFFADVNGWAHQEEFSGDAKDMINLFLNR